MPNEAVAPLFKKVLNVQGTLSVSGLASHGSSFDTPAVLTEIQKLKSSAQPFTLCPTKIEYVFPGMRVVKLRNISAVEFIGEDCIQSTSVSEPQEPSKTKTRLKQLNGATLFTEIFISAAEATKEYQTPGFGILNIVQAVEIPLGNVAPPHVLPGVHDALTVKGVAVAQVVLVGLH
tara:strand:- start:412 stop:939 length:528 start_codon:yes stop_codon:yes gene_type:complete